MAQGSQWLWLTSRAETLTQKTSYLRIKSEIGIPPIVLRVLTLILKLLKLQQNPAKIKVSIEFKDSA